ncbi:MAG: YdcF family protein [Uliginosibacterium sp.]|nr:YdcF family protein [Uliginosibacterium sp.]
MHQYPDGLIVVSGGQGFNEASTEALAMQRGLLQQGIAPGASCSNPAQPVPKRTCGSPVFVLEVRKLTPRQPCGNRDQQFHVPRTRHLAQAAGFGNATVVATPTPRAILLNVWLREYLAWIKAVLGGAF